MQTLSSFKRIQLGGLTYNEQVRDGVSSTRSRGSSCLTVSMLARVWWQNRYHCEKLWHIAEQRESSIYIARRTLNN
ncbi:hypothetical protein DY000_02058846 [Brassica cretica]|uniref:Uncharacterized protein n=1 Tax=Brassica cretica TaxID=69181 RepID=A0ABQ7AYR6_BRACR|nr:hypothetical protein DY000_02058846 [Brassica cretica]